MAERRGGHLQKYEAGGEGLHNGSARQSHHDIIGFREVCNTHAAACDHAHLRDMTSSRPTESERGPPAACGLAWRLHAAVQPVFQTVSLFFTSIS